MAKLLMKGNEALAEAAIRAGCRGYFGYPITPQNEVGHYMAKRMPEVGGVFLQAESEVAAINMVYGAAATGKRVMTTSSSPGMSLKQEGLSYMAGADLPCVVVNIVRAGPGLGGILPAQGDYFQATKGGGHGDYRTIVLAPSSVQELYEMTVEAFNLADKYRMTVTLLGDGVLGQMMESVEFKEQEEIIDVDKSWAANGTKMKRPHNEIESIQIDPDLLEARINTRLEKYNKIEAEETRYEDINCEDAEIILVAYGTAARIAKNVVKEARKEGIQAGLIRPISLWPFPVIPFDKYACQTKAFLTVEMSTGQMVEDVRLAVKESAPVYFHGRTGGNIPNPSDIMNIMKEVLA